MRKMWSLVLAVLMFCVPVLSGAEAVYGWPMEALAEGKTVMAESTFDPVTLEIVGAGEEETTQVMSVVDIANQVLSGLKIRGTASQTGSQLELFMNDSPVFDARIGMSGDAVLVQSSWLGEKAIGITGEELKELLKQAGIDLDEIAAKLQEFMANPIDPAEAFPNTIAAAQGLATLFTVAEEVTQPENADPAVGQASGVLTGEKTVELLEAMRTDILANEQLKAAFRWSDGYNSYEGEEAVQKAFDSLTAQAACVDVTVTLWVDEDSSPVAVDIQTKVNKTVLEGVTGAMAQNAMVDYLTGLGYGEDMEKETFTLDPDAEVEYQEALCTYRRLTGEDGVAEHTLGFVSGESSLEAAFRATEEEMRAVITGTSKADDATVTMNCTVLDTHTLRTETASQDNVIITENVHVVSEDSDVNVQITGNVVYAAEKDVSLTVDSKVEGVIIAGEGREVCFSAGEHSATTPAEALPEMDAANAIYPMSLTGEEQAEVLQTITQNAQLGLMKLIQQLPAELLVMLNGGAAK